MGATIRKSFLFIFQQAPHANLAAKEGLDFAFSCAAFDQSVDVFFMQDGVYQLLKNQTTEALQQKNHSASIDALTLYGIDNCFYQEDCAQKRDIDAEQINDLAKALTHEQSAELLKNYDYIFTY